MECLSKSNIPPPIETISDLIHLAQSNIIYDNIDMDMLARIIDPLLAINSLIGMDSLKRTIVQQVLFYLLNFDIMT